LVGEQCLEMKGRRFMELYEIPVDVLGGAAGDYIKNKSTITSFFDYVPYGVEFTKRAKHLEERTYPREQLAAYFTRYNEELGAGARTIENIRAFREEDALVVVGGQQAGMLTGPLYTIHKIISLLQLAKEQEQQLGKRVVPVFWIAGEDHDMNEINHIYVTSKGKLKKSVLPQMYEKKASASQVELSQDMTLAWVESIFKTFRETKYTKELLELVKVCLHHSRTYTDFFGRLIMEIFKEEGLILMDSGAPELRRIEIPFFQTLIQKEMQIRTALKQTQQRIVESGYEPLITTKPEVCHLFLDIEGERWLLERRDDLFVCKDGEYAFTEVELLELLEKEPQRFSNNVVTRPLMQEYVLPTLAFVGGPGEIAYWAELQGVFHEVGWMMPPVVPRFMLSYLEGHIASDMIDLGLDVAELFSKKLGEAREAWLAAQVQEPVEETFAQVHEEIMRSHEVARELVERINPSLRSYAYKNQRKIEEQLQLLERMLRKNIEQKHDVSLNKFRRIELSLQPAGGLQERTWNVLYYLNEYGLDWIHHITQLSFTWDDTHKVIKL
jgi:bacillithiol biosynthesis cysteine-adding enzyme BshC